MFDESSLFLNIAQTRLLSMSEKEVLLDALRTDQLSHEYMNTLTLVLSQEDSYFKHLFHNLSSLPQGFFGLSQSVSHADDENIKRLESLESQEEIDEIFNKLSNI